MPDFFNPYDFVSTWLWSRQGSEFQALSGSRYGVFEEYERRFGYRSSSQESADLVPVWIIATVGRKHALRPDGMPPCVGEHPSQSTAFVAPGWGA